MTDKERKIAFSKNLKKILESSHKNQIDVANAIGVSQQTFNTWCRGVAIPRMGKIQLLADYFGINMSDLIEPQKGDVDSDKKFSSLSDLETEIIIRFRQADEFDQETVLRTLRIKRADYIVSEADA